MHVCILFFKNKIKNIDGDKSLHDFYVRIIKGRPEIPGGTKNEHESDFDTWLKVAPLKREKKGLTFLLVVER